MHIDWQTPKALFANLEREFHFTLDVCALPWNAQCKDFFTPIEDGLARKWSGVCWCNPPFDSTRGKWVKKSFEEAQRGVTTALIVNASCCTDNEWWHKFALRSSEIRFIRGRPAFLDINGKVASMRTILLVFRPYCGGPPVVSSVDRNGAPYIAEGLQTAANKQSTPCPDCGSHSTRAEEYYCDKCGLTFYP